MLLAFGWTAVYPQNALEKAGAFSVKHLNGPLVSLDTIKKILVVNEKSVDYAVSIDSATMVTGRDGAIALANLKIKDPVSVEYRKYSANKRIANQITQKTAFVNKQAEKSDSATKALIKPQQSQKNDTTLIAKGQPASEKTEAKAEPFLIKHLNGPLVSLDTIKMILVVNEKSVDYAVSIDSATMVTGRDGAIALANLKIKDPVSMEYRKYNANKRIANQIAQKTAFINKLAVKSDSTSKATIKLPLTSEKIDSSKQIKGPQVSEKTEVKAEVQVEAFLTKHLNGPLLSADTSKGILVVKGKSVDYTVSVDSATMVLGLNQVITLANLKTNDSVSVEYREYNANKKIANQITQKTVLINKQAAKPDSTAKALIKPQQSKKNDTTLTAKGPPASEKTEAFLIKHLNGPLVSLDTLKGILIVMEKSVNYAVSIDSATNVLGGSGVIALSNLKIKDSVSVEYRKYNANKRIANQIAQKTAFINKQAAKPDSTAKALIKPQQSEKIEMPKTDTATQLKSAPTIEASKLMLEKALSNKTREQLYRDIFHTAPPKLANKVQVTLVINDTTDGTMEIIFIDDRQDFSLPAAPVMKILSKIATPELLKKVTASIDSTGRIRQSVLTGMGLQTTFDNEAYVVKILVPSIFLLKQVHQLSGQMENPYAVETIKPNVFSAYCNIQADQQYKYFQNLSADSTSAQTFMIESINKNVRRPFAAHFDGAINVKNVVLEGMSYYQEGLPHSLQRQDIRLVYDRPQQALRFSAGDIQYLTLGYQASVRMGGVSISKDLSLQPYVLTYPVSEHEFYLTDPAEAEIWVNDVMVSKMILEAGTHDIRGFPFSTGNNNVKIILRDFSGRRDTMDFSFQYNTTLLAKGYSRYSFNAGFPSYIVQQRYSYNEDQPCFSLAYQRGITDRLTLDLYSQAFTSEINSRMFYNTVDTNTLFSKGYKLSHSLEGMLGFGGLYAFPLGFIGLNAAGSYINNRGPGCGLRLAYTYETKVSYKNSMEKKPGALKLNTPLIWTTQAEYLSPKFLKSPVDSPYNYLEALKLSTNLIVPLSGQFTVSSGGKYYVRRDTADLFELMLRLQKTWLKNLNVSLTFQYTSDLYGHEANPAIIASLQWLFRSNKNEFGLSEEISRHKPDNPVQSASSSQTSQTTQTSTPQWDFNTGIQWNYDDFKPRPERVLASANAQFGPQINDYNALVGYTGNQGTIELTQDMFQPEYAGADYLQHQTDLSVKTALVYVDKTVCFSRPLYSGGFVLAKGVKNLNGNTIKVNPTEQGYEAVTNFFGPAVLPLYAPYQLKRIKVEPENPPMGFMNEKSSFMLFPHYKSGFCLSIGSEKSVLVLGTLQDFDGSPFGYQSISIVAASEKKAVPAATFTNGIGRFQFLGHESQTYKIMPPPGWDRMPVTLRIPRDNKGFYQAGVLNFAQTRKPAGAVKADTVRADTAKPTTIKKDTAKTDISKTDSMKTLNMNVDTTNVPRISVVGTLGDSNGKALDSTSILISFLDSTETPSLNRILHPNSVTNDHGLFQFVCSKTGKYKITVTAGSHKNGGVSFDIPAGTKHSFNIGNLRLK